MRDLAAYQSDYESLPFEEVQALFRKRKILEALDRKSARAILEIGCGLDPIFNHYGAFDECTVVEPASQFAANAVRAAGPRPGIRIIESTLQDAADELSRKSFDVVILSSLLHELPEPESLLSATIPLCRPETVVHVNVPNALSFHRLLAESMGLITDPYQRSDTQIRMQQSHVYDLRTLEALVTRSGFRVLAKGTFFVKPFTHLQMALLQKAGFLTTDMLEGLYALSEHFPNNGSEIWMDLATA